MTKDEREILLDYFHNGMLFPQPLDNSVYSCEKTESIRNAIITLIEELKQEQQPQYFPPCIDCNGRMNSIIKAYNNAMKYEDAREKLEQIKIIVRDCNDPLDCKVKIAKVLEVKE